MTDDGPDLPVGLQFKEKHRAGFLSEDECNSLGDRWIYGLEPGDDCDLYAELVIMAIDERWVYLTVVAHHKTDAMPELTKNNGWLQGGLN